MLNLKRTLPVTLAMLLLVFTPIVFASGYSIIIENFDPNPETTMSMNVTTDFKWNGVDTYDNLPLSHFKLCFEYFPQQNSPVVYCPLATLSSVFQNHISMTPADWQKTIKGLQGFLESQGNLVRLNPDPTIPLYWFVQGVYSDSVKQEVIQSYPWSLQLAS